MIERYNNEKRAWEAELDNTPEEREIIGRKILDYLNHRRRYTVEPLPTHIEIDWVGSHATYLIIVRINDYRDVIDWLVKK